MTIKEKGYAHWDGKLEERRFNWWPITRLGISLTFKKKFFKFTFLVSLLPALIYLVGIYIAERIEDFPFIESGQADFLKTNPGYFYSYFTQGSLLFIMIAILIFSGSGLISDDLKHNALQLYFSRPIKKSEYFLGKISTIFFFIFILTLVPGIVFLLMKFLFAGNFRFFVQYPWLPLSICAYSVIIAVFLGLYTLFLSSLSTNRRYVGILIFAVYFFTDILFGIFNSIFHNQYFVLFSIRWNLKQVGAAFFQQKGHYDVPWILSLLVLTVICGLAVLVLHKRVRGVEVIK
ncbi:MAG: ABC transporter permease [Candidatus Aminicenantes bacterium]|nr:ABC transporter permease [Candidatus Aminicenantes bacterium]